MDNYIAHILVVDDDDGIRELVKRYLNENNLNILSMRNETNRLEELFLDLTEK